MKIRFGMVLIELGSLGSPIILRSSWFVSSFKDIKLCLKECRENKGDVYLVPWIFACKGKRKNDRQKSRGVWGMSTCNNGRCYDDQGYDRGCCVICSGSGCKSPNQERIEMTDKRAEALERARALRARYDSATTVHPSTYAQLADAGELLAMHAENERIKKERDDFHKSHRAAWTENEKLTADNAAKLRALQRVRQAWLNNGAATEEMKRVCNDIDLEILGPTSPGQALLQRIEKLEAVARAVKGFREHGVAKNGTHATVMFDALEALDGENKS